MAMHTPAPWTLNEPIMGDAHIEAPHAMIGVVFDSESEEGRANGRLITGAPGLLAACHAALRKVDDAALRTLLEDAINKATDDRC